MHRIQIGVLCLLMVFVFGITLDVAGQETTGKKQVEQKIEDMKVPMGIIVLGAPESVEQKRTAVNFPHFRHFGFHCKKCHHKWEGDAKIPTCTTSDCHDLLKSPKKPTKYLSYTDTGIKYYKYAFHQQCIGCHKEIKIKRKKMEMSYKTLEVKLPKTGPTECKECHPKLEE